MFSVELGELCCFFLLFLGLLLLGEGGRVRFGGRHCLRGWVEVGRGNRFAALLHDRVYEAPVGVSNVIGEICKLRDGAKAGPLIHSVTPGVAAAVHVIVPQEFDDVLTWDGTFLGPGEDHKPLDYRI